MLQGALISVCTMIAFQLGLRQSGAAVASTMAFATLTLARLFHGFNCRSSHSIFRLGFKDNWYSLGAFVLGFALLSLVLFVPVMGKLFSVSPLSGLQVGIVYGLAIIPTVMIQLTKVMREIVK